MLLLVVVVVVEDDDWVVVVVVPVDIEQELHQYQVITTYSELFIGAGGEGSVREPVASGSERSDNGQIPSVFLHFLGT